jgi:hypothetical protein
MTPITNDLIIESLIFLCLCILVVLGRTFSACPCIDEAKDLARPPSFHHQEAKGDKSDD